MKMLVKGKPLEINPIVVLIIIIVVLILGSVLTGVLYKKDTKSVKSDVSSFKITWSHPEVDTEGNIEDVSRITGYDIWYTYQDGERQYAKWFPLDSVDDVLEYDFPFQEMGKYCFQLATVTKEDGKSNLSTAVCAETEVIDPDLGKPEPPITIIVTVIGTSNVEVITEIEDATY